MSSDIFSPEAMAETARCHKLIRSWYRSALGPHRAPNPTTPESPRLDVAHLVDAVAQLARMERGLTSEEVGHVRDLAVLVRAAAEAPDDLAGTGGREFLGLVAQVVRGYDRTLAELPADAPEEAVAAAIGHGLFRLSVPDVDPTPRPYDRRAVLTLLWSLWERRPVGELQSEATTLRKLCERAGCEPPVDLAAEFNALGYALGTDHALHGRLISLSDTQPDGSVRMSGDIRVHIAYAPGHVAREAPTGGDPIPAVVLATVPESDRG